MSAFKQLKSIKFERPSLVFTAGEIIRGSLIFDDLERPLKIFDLNLLVTGVVRQCAYYRPYIEHKRHLVDYSYKILTVYAQTQVTKSHEAVTIPHRTKFELEFEIKLPESLWSTFIGGLGYTIYRLILEGRKNSPAFGKEGLLCHNEIVVIGVVDPIKDGFTLPFSQSKSFTSPSGEVAKLSVNLDKTWASPGEMFGFQVIVENGLKLPLNSVKMVFQQNVNYEFKGPSPKLFARQQKDQEVIILVQKDGPSIPPGPKRRVPWNYSFKIPHIVPSDLGSDGCPLIKINYCITFVLAKFVNLQIMVPIHVGTSSDVDWEEASMQYDKELKRSLSSQSLAAWSNSNEMGSCWSLMDAVGSECKPSSSSSSTPLPPYEPY